MPFRVAVLTGNQHKFPLDDTLQVLTQFVVSDTAAKNPAADLSGPTIREIVSSTEGYIVSDGHCSVVPDEKELIARVAAEYCASGEVDWLITTGGTGFGVRDVTPEVDCGFLPCLN